MSGRIPESLADTAPHLYQLQVAGNDFEGKEGTKGGATQAARMMGSTCTLPHALQQLMRLPHTPPLLVHPACTLPPCVPFPIHPPIHPPHSPMSTRPPACPQATCTCSPTTAL